MAEIEKVIVSAEGRGFEKLQGKMAALAASSKLLSQRNSQLSGSIGQSNRQMRQAYNHTNSLSDRTNILAQSMNKASSASRFFMKSARFLMFAVIGLAIEFAVVAASLMSINAAFAAGNAIMKAYKWSMGGVAAAAAAVGATLAVAAVAQREFTAAQYAHTQKATPKFGSAMNHSMAMLRNLTSDAQLAVFGVENLSAAFAAVSRNSQFTGKSQQVLRALRDFAAIGGDQGKNLAAIGEFVGLLQKEGKVTAKVTEAAKAVGPEFEKAFKKIKKGGGGVQDIFKSILSGDMSKAANITGAADLMSGTLVGMFKKFKTLLTSLFADIGTPLLGPAKEALEQIYNIIRNGIERISPALVAFGKGSFLDTIVKAIEKITNFTVNLFDKYLPQSEGMLTSVKNVYIEFKKAWQFITTALDKLRAGGSIVIDMFAKPLNALFGGIGDNVEHFAELAVNNKEDFLAFGDKLADVVDALMDFAAKFKEAFVAALPTINQVLTVVEKIIRLLGTVVGGLAGLPLGGELITGIAGYGLLKGRRAAQRAGRRGTNLKVAGQSMGGAAMNMMGLPLFPGMGLTHMTPTVGQGGVVTGTSTMTGAQANAARGASRFAGGRIGSRFPGLTSTMGRLGGFLNPMGSMNLAQQAYFDANDFIYESQPQQLMSGNAPSWRQSQAMQTPGAYRDASGNIVVDRDVQRANPNAKTGFRRQMGGAGAKLKGGFSMGGLLAGQAISAFAQSDMAPSMMKENAGAISMGANLMSIHPMLGLGAMGVGTLSNLVQGKGARTKGGGVGTGMLAGAATGAAIGSFVPVIGTAVGALVGTVIGGITGYFGGQKAEKMVAKQAARALGGKTLRSVAGSLINGFTNEATAASNKLTQASLNYETMSDSEKRQYITSLEKQGTITGTEAERGRAHLGDFGKELRTQSMDTEAATKSLITQFDSVMNGLQGSTGKSKDELLELAKTMNVNLYDPTVNLTEAIEGLGLKMDLTAGGLARSGTDMILQANKVFDEVNKSKELTSAMNAAGRGIYTAGGGSKEDYIDYMRKTTAYLAEKNADNPLAQLYGFQNMFGEGGDLFKKGNQLGSVGRGDFEKNAGSSYTKLVNRQASNLATSRTGGIMQLIAGSGLEFSDGAAGFQGIKSQLETMYKSDDKGTREKARGLENFLSSGASLGSTPEQIAKTLSSFGIDLGAAGALTTSTAGTLADQLEGQQKELQKSLVSAIGTGFDDKPEWWNGTPAWWGNAGTGTPDTSSPRAKGVGDTISSRLSRTMSRHNYFNSGLTGKRSITSSWRNHSLGSPSSDHATGNAYDLVGQNLGQYATTINKAGGFAEFHGAAGSRHLHVVPPSSPVGDTGTSRIGQSAPRATTSENLGGVTINVYATDKQDERAIARIVMSEISKAQRNYRERK
jgi:hypothetical protein